MKIEKSAGVAVVLLFSLFLISPRIVLAHCDTMDGPVVQDARLALEAKDVTPVLKWVRPADEKKVTAAFAETLATQGKKEQKAAEERFLETLVRIHRAGEGASFSGVRPAGEVEPIIAEADRALVGGSVDKVVKMMNEAVSKGIRLRYEKAAEAMKHKDENVEAGRRFVAAYVEYTHYLELMHREVEGTGHHAKSAGECELKGHEHRN
jgi:hypothetical protein